MKTSPLQKLVSILLLAAVAVVAVNAWFAFRAEEVLSTSEYWVAHTWEVIASLEQAMGSVKDAETGSRGYLLTGENEYLQPYNAAVQNLPGELDHVQQLTVDNPRQQARMEEMRTVIFARLTVLQQEIAKRESNKHNAGRLMLESGSGGLEMEHIRRLVERMQAEERELLLARTSRSATAREEAKVTIAFASALDLLFIVVSLWLLRHERGLRRKADATSERLEKLQTISDVGLTQLTSAELTTEMLARLRHVASADAVVLCNWHAGEGEVEIMAANGVQVTAGARVPLRAGGPMERARLTNQPVRLSGDEVAASPVEALRTGMDSLLILPLSISSRVIALLVAARRQSNSFSEEDEHLLSVVADRIALSIDRSNLFEAERTARRIAEESATQVQSLNEALEERVRQRTAELETTNRELEAFSYAVSHDLRAPLRSVDGFSSALVEDYGEVLQEEGKHYLGRIRAGVQRMGQLIDALLQLSRITRSELSIEQVDLSALAADVAAELEQQNADRAFQFKIEPALSTQGDPRLLRVVFENMFGNAVKFTAREPLAHIAFGYEPERAAYYIRDNGAGFDQQYVEKLFVAFQRLHGEKDFKGSGIGLATVARVIRRHWGTIDAEGVVGEGATFWFTLKATP